LVSPGFSGLLLPNAQHISFPPFAGLLFLLSFSFLASYYGSFRRLHVEIPGPEKEIWEKELGASGALCAVVESQPGAFLRNVSARGNLPFLRVCQYD
jgi:hypothetical protein